MPPNATAALVQRLVRRRGTDRCPQPSTPDLGDLSDSGLVKMGELRSIDLRWQCE
jgi:hypothetical protein